ncbi:DUF4931 domain-containing protein [Patescibacteria group bacterium AH-259-L05]|nr:DUF4931 domain-containing protein [Patescibacteria group bacterium AH-259-L05]
MTKSEIRKDYFLDKYVIITPRRSKRPRGVMAKTTFKRTSECPFCPAYVEKNLVIKSYPTKDKTFPWSIMVLKNKYPVVTYDNDKAYGEHEVLIETPRHGEELSQLSVSRIVAMLEAFKDRTRKISKIKNIDYILIFKNEGGKAGATLAHAHCQIFASQLLPPDLSQEFVAMEKYHRTHRRCPYCDIISKEEKSSRKIYADEYIVAFAPYASQYHYETWILPRRHVDNIVGFKSEETKYFAKALKGILEKIYNKGLSYNFFLHQVISKQNQHFYLKIQPRESVWAGIELGAGIVVNSIAPEEAAKYLRL